MAAATIEFEEHSGYVELAGKQLGATLKSVDDRLELEVLDPEPNFISSLPEDVSTAKFIGHKSYFTLIRLMRVHTSGRLGLGGISKYRVNMAVQEGLFESEEDITSSTWLVYLEGIERIYHVSGYEQNIAWTDNSKPLFSWSYRSAEPMLVSCPKSGVLLEFSQDMKSSGDRFTGPSIDLRYPVSIKFGSEVGIVLALQTVNRIRLFFSLMMGRVLAIEEVALKSHAQEAAHTMRLHGLLRSPSYDKPAEPVARCVEGQQVGGILDEWLTRFDALDDAIHLHFDALEQRRLPMQLRFQLFVQALEALHRRTHSAAGKEIDRPPVIEALEVLKVPKDVIDRVDGILTHAHEPGIRQRLKYYWERYADEIAVLRPGVVKRSFVSRVAATRNYYAHGLDMDENVLQGLDLYNYIETLKAISHLALLDCFGLQTSGLGQEMLSRRFVEYSLNS